MTVPEIADALVGRQSAKNKHEQEAFGEAVFHQMDRGLRLAAADRPDAETFGRRQS